MSQVQEAEHVIPVGEFKSHVDRWMEELRGTGASVVLTRDGKPFAVLVSSDIYDGIRDQVAAANRGGPLELGEGDLDEEVDSMFAQLAIG